MPNNGESILLVSPVHRVYLFDRYSKINDDDPNLQWFMKRYTVNNDNDLAWIWKKYRVDNDNIDDTELEWTRKKYRVDNDSIDDTELDGNVPVF